MQEIYKEIKGFEGRYAVSNKGNVISLNYNHTHKSKVLHPVKHHSGYLYVHLGGESMRSIHSLVADAFLEKPSEHHVVNHIDGNKQNNNVGNLEWVTNAENVQHAVRTGLRDPHSNNVPKGWKNYHSKPVLQYSKDGILITEWSCISDAARHIGCNPCMIVNNASGRTKSCHGFIWKYPLTSSCS